MKILDEDNTHLSVPAFEDDSKSAMSYQVLPTELKLPHRLHPRAKV